MRKILIFLVSVLFFSCSAKHEKIQFNGEIGVRASKNEFGSIDTVYFIKDNGKESTFRVIIHGYNRRANRLFLDLRYTEDTDSGVPIKCPIEWEKEKFLLESVIDTLSKKGYIINGLFLEQDYLGDATVLFAKQMQAHLVEEPIYSDKNTEALKHYFPRSVIYNEIEDIFERHGMVIEHVSYDDFWYFTTKEEFLEDNIVTVPDVPDKIMMFGTLCIDVARK